MTSDDTRFAFVIEKTFVWFGVMYLEIFVL